MDRRPLRHPEHAGAGGAHQARCPQWGAGWPQHVLRPAQVHPAHSLPEDGQIRLYHHLVLPFYQHGVS